MSKYNKGDIIKYIKKKPKKKWFNLKKEEKNDYIYSYKNQGEIDEVIKLKNGDIFIVQENYDHILSLSKFNKNNTIFLTYLLYENFYILSEKEIRKEKILNLKKNKKIKLWN